MVEPSPSEVLRHDRVLPVLCKQTVVPPMRALPHQDVTAAVATAPDGAEAVRLAFEFLVRTAARWAMSVGASWTGRDTSDNAWAIPAVRRKENRERRVPLRTEEILDAARMRDVGRPLVLTVKDGEPPEEKAPRRLPERQRAAAVPHEYGSHDAAVARLPEAGGQACRACPPGARDLSGRNRRPAAPALAVDANSVESVRIVDECNPAGPSS